jgi:hypothetical protein
MQSLSRLEIAGYSSCTPLLHAGFDDDYDASIVTKEEAMKTLKRVLMSTALLALPLSALANGGHHEERGHSYQKHQNKEYGQRDHGRHDYRHQDRRDYRHRDYRDVRGHERDRHMQRQRVYGPAAPVIYAPPVIPVRQGVTIHSNVHIPM